jgi:hypothetical protein
MRLESRISQAWTSLMTTSSLTNVQQGDQKVSVHLMITIQKVTSDVQSVTLQPPDIYCTLTLTPSAIPNYNYVIMVSDWNCINIFACFLQCNHHVHRDVLSTLYLFINFNCAKLLQLCFFLHRLTALNYGSQLCTSGQLYKAFTKVPELTLRINSSKKQATAFCYQVL